MELLAARSPVQEPASPQPLPPVHGGSRVSFEALYFRYPSRPTHSALEDFSLAVEPGQTVALVGPSGAGKTTVFSLLLRFYDAQGGQILLDGVPVGQLSLADLRHRVGIVPQDPVIFSTSALENIRYGRPEASDDEVRDAARAPLPTSSSPACPRATRPTWANGASGCRAVSDNASRLPGPC